MSEEMFLSEARKKSILEDTISLGEYKSQRIYIEEYKKVLKARIMKEAMARGISSIQAQEREAYASYEYEEVINGLEIAVKFETELYWKLKIFDMELQVWRTNQANQRNDI